MHIANQTQIDFWTSAGLSALQQLANLIEILQPTMSLSVIFSITLRHLPEMQGLQQHLQISVRHPDYVIEQSFGAWEVTAEMAADPVLANEKLFPKGIISLEPGFEVSGQILLPDGKPAQGVSLYAAWQMPEYLNMPPHAVTDAAGRFKFRVGGFDETWLFIMPNDAVAQSIPIQKQYGEHPVVKLEAGTVITGRVLDDKGQPLGNVVVQGNGNDTVYTGFPNPMARVATDAEGRYKLPPMKLPVDVRVGRFGYLGGWSSSQPSPEGAYLPVLLCAPQLQETAEAPPNELKPDEAANPKSMELDFRPVETVTMTARAYSEKGNLTDDENIELFGVFPDPRAPVDQRVPRWRGSFRSVPGQAGVYQLKAPRGLVNATIDMTNSGSNNSQNLWSRAVREGETLSGPRTNAGWSVLDRDDDSIMVGTPNSKEWQNAANTDDKTDSTTQNPEARLPADERTVTLKVDNHPRRQILKQLAEAARLEVIFDEVSLAKTDFDLEQLMSVDFVDEPLWQTVGDVCEFPFIISAGPVAVCRQNQLIITTMEAEATRKRTPLPEWLSALQSQGVGGTTDDDGEVNIVSVREKGLTDGLLARLPELQHLRELTVDPRGPATDAGLAQLSKLHSLETLSITSGETTVFRTDQLLAHVKSLPNLKSISFHESGVSDEGIAHIAEIKSIERLSLYQDGRVTDRGIELIAEMPQLKGLDLTQYVFLSYMPKMQYSPEALARISQLTNLETLSLNGIDTPSALQIPHGLKGLTLTGSEVNDETAAGIAACSNLKSLNLRATAISDEGLRQIADGTKLSHLTLWETPITDAGIAHLKSLPLQHIEVRQLQLTDLSLSHIAQIKTLSRLDLFGSGPADFLNPQGPGFTLDGMRVLKDLPRLRTLWLTGYPPDANYTALADLKQLRELTFMMALQNEHDLECLKAELPKTRITASTGGGMVGQP